MQKSEVFFIRTDQIHSTLSLRPDVALRILDYVFEQVLEPVVGADVGDVQYKFIFPQQVNELV